MASQLSTLDTPMAVSTTMESVMPMLSPMAMAMASPLSTVDTPMAVSTTMESVMPMLSPMPGVMAMASPLSTMDTPMAVSTMASKELLSSGLNCGTFKNCLRRIIQLPDSWIPKKQVQNDYILQTA